MAHAARLKNVVKKNAQARAKEDASGVAFVKKKRTDAKKKDMARRKAGHLKRMTAKIKARKDAAKSAEVMAFAKKQDRRNKVLRGISLLKGK